MIFTVWRDSHGPDEALHLSFGALKKGERRSLRQFFCGKTKVQGRGMMFEGQVTFREGEFPFRKYPFPKRIWVDVPHCEGCVRVYEEIRSLGVFVNLSEDDIARMLNERINNGTSAGTA